MGLQFHAKLILSLLGSAVVALVIAFILAAISVSGVTNMVAADVFLWIALDIVAISLLATGIIYCNQLSGGKSALLALLLLSLAWGACVGRAHLSAWITSKKMDKLAAESAHKPASTSPNSGQSNEGKQATQSAKRSVTPADTDRPAANKSSKVIIHGDRPTVNPAAALTPIIQGNCGVVQNGGIGNVASPNCAPPQRVFSDKQSSDFVEVLRSTCPFAVAVRPITGNSESMKYADQIKKILESAGCKPQNPRFLIDTAPSYGLMIAVHDLKEIPPGADALAKALNAAGVPWKRLDTDMIQAGVVYIMVGLDETKP